MSVCLSTTHRYTAARMIVPAPYCTDNYPPLHVIDSISLGVPGEAWAWWPLFLPGIETLTTSSCLLNYLTKFSLLLLRVLNIQLIIVNMS